MPIDLKIVSERLKQCRKALDYDTTEASLASGISISRLQEIETGLHSPTGDEILILATLYKCDFLQLIDQTLPAPSDLTDILFRRYGESFNQSDKRSIQEFLFFCRNEKYLEDLLIIKKTTPEFYWSGSFYKAHGADAAKTLREHLQIPKNGINRDIYDDFRKIGVHIFRRKLSSSEISGLYINDPIAGHCALINYNEDIYRQRFSAAHEVAHSIFDSSQKTSVSYENSSPKYSARDLIEIRANSFASNYLMPPEILKSVSNWSSDNFAYWAQQFRVSTSALAKALTDQNIVTLEQAKSLKKTRVAQSEKIDPEAPHTLTDLQRERRLKLLQRGLSDYYVNLCYEAQLKGLISTHRLCELLNIEPSELPEIGKLFGRTINYVF